MFNMVNASTLGIQRRFERCKQLLYFNAAANARDPTLSTPFRVKGKERYGLSKRTSGVTNPASASLGYSFFPTDTGQRAGVRHRPLSFSHLKPLCISSHIKKRICDC